MAQMSGRFRDFDAWEAERKGEPLRFRVRGKTFELPPALPALIPIRAMRLQKQYGSQAEIPQHEMLDLALALFGEEQLEDLLATGIGMDALAEIVSWAVEEYTGASQGNAPGPGEVRG